VCFRSYYVVKRFGSFSRLLAGDHIFMFAYNIFGRRVLDYYSLITNPVRRYRSTHYSSSSRRYKLPLLTDNAECTCNAAAMRADRAAAGATIGYPHTRTQLTAQYKLYGSNIKSLDFYTFNPLKQHTFCSRTCVRMAMRL